MLLYNDISQKPQGEFHLIAWILEIETGAFYSFPPIDVQSPFVVTFSNVGITPGFHRIEIRIDPY